MSDLRYRQSRLRSFAQCPRRGALEVDWAGGTIGASADLGSAFAAFAAEYRRTLWRLGEPNMATQEAVEIMREVLAAGPWVLGPGDGTASSTGYDMLVQMVCAMADQKWRPDLFLGVEDRLSHPVMCPDGKQRLITGAPDLISADPPRGILAHDDKTGMARPREPRASPEGDEPVKGLEYWDEPKHAEFQLKVYGFLGLKQWPRATHYTGREKNWRWNGRWREATITRDDLEHIEPWLGDLAMKLDRALDGDADYQQPRSGAHCVTRCKVAQSCPIPQEQRGEGSIANLAEATVAANRREVMRAVEKQLDKSLKAYHKETGEPIPTDGGTLQWWTDDSGKRAFEVRA